MRVSHFLFCVTRSERVENETARPRDRESEIKRNRTTERYRNTEVQGDIERQRKRDRKTS